MAKLEEDKYNPIKSIELFGYKSYFESFKELFKRNKLPKVIMLSGEKGMGKFTFAFHLINFFNQSKSKFPYDLNNLTINVKDDFYKQILSGTNENFYCLGKTNNRTVSVDEIREIKKNFASTTLNDLPRFVILDDADLLNASSANALLKLIEEPSKKNFFILINNKRKKIMETLKSRSLEYKIFLNKNDKNYIVKKLFQKNNISFDLYSQFIEKTTPGIYLRISSCLDDEKIDSNTKLYDSANILLDKYKKNKSFCYLESIKFLLDVEINHILQNNKKNLLETVILKREITKLLFEYEYFGLSKSSVLESFKSIPRYV